MTMRQRGKNKPIANLDFANKVPNQSSSTTIKIYGSTHENWQNFD